MSCSDPTQTDAAAPVLTVSAKSFASEPTDTVSDNSLDHRFSSLVRRAAAFHAGSAVLAVTAILGGLAYAYARSPQTVLLSSGIALGMAAVLLALGFVAVRRCLSPVADIERQLHRFASASIMTPESAEPASGFSALEVGWNRLVQFLRSAECAPDLNQRLQTAVATYRERQGERILNALTDGIAVTDAAQRITCVNNALYSILREDAETGTLLGVSIEDALAREAEFETGKRIFDDQRLRHRAVAEIGCAREDSSITLRVCRTPLGTDSSQAGFVWSVRDVTQQKLADQMRDQFVNAATHELRTPMANIKAYAETLALGEVDDVEQQKMFCNVINDEVTRLARFIDDLLHLSRMEVGATTLQLQVTDMGRLMEETAEKVRPQMIQKKQQFSVDLPAKLPELIVDKDKLAVAIINLLGNAAKYTPEGGSVRMSVSLPGNSLQIDVEDTGIGISEEELPKVLEKFYRSSDPRVYGETGSGLGLSLTQEIIRLHGGKLSVTSELNKGSKFTIVLPVTAE